MNSFILGKDIEIMSHFFILFEGETASTARQDPGALLSYLLKVHKRHFELELDKTYEDGVSGQMSEL